MNLSMMARVLGRLLLLLALAQGVCLLIARWGWGSDSLGAGDVVEAFLASTSITFVMGLILTWIGRSTLSVVLRKEAIAIVGLGWFVCALFGALPYMLMEPHLGFVDALFESMSGFTTTGASVIRDVEALSRPLLFWRSLTQWLGGMGILVLFVALLSSLRVDTLFLIALAGTTVIAGTVIVSFLEPHLDMDTCVSAVLATLFNIGPGLGSVGPTGNFADLSAYTKLVLIVLMALGRLEFYAILALFMPSLWRRY